MIADAIEAELTLLQPAVRSDVDAVDALLAPDFTEIGRSGRVWDRAGMLASIAGFESSTVAVDASEVSGRRVGDDLVLVTYSTPGALRSSLWRRSDGRWRVVFHQATPVA